VTISFSWTLLLYEVIIIIIIIIYVKLVFGWTKHLSTKHFEMMCEDGETVFEFYWNMNDNMAAVRI
jgi:hypothetical protein